MRPLKFLPLAFIAGIDGFALFAPYVLVILAAAHLIRRRTWQTNSRWKAPADPVT